MENWVKKHLAAATNTGCWRKYLTIFKISWQNSLVYRLKFILWRLRTLILVLTSYFFWWAVYQSNAKIGDYDATLMLTYILGTFLLADLLSSLSIEVGPEIGSGNLSNYLIKPINYFHYWLARDWAHKLLNTIFVCIELFIVFIVLKPSLFINRNLVDLVFAFFVILIALGLNFYLNLLISLLAFWHPEHNGWPQRFLFNTLLLFLAGMYFPFDVFPKFLSYFFQFLPTGLILYFPLQIYLGRVAIPRILVGILMIIGWTFVFIKLNLRVWRAGLKKYASEGI